MESSYISDLNIDQVYPDSIDTPLRVFKEFARESVVYCHWESNAELQEGLLGYKDLDVLVEKGCSRSLNNALIEAGFKRFQAVATNGFPAVEDYLGLDLETGMLCHLHLHHQIVMGEKHLKSYHLPWEQKVLATRVFDHKEKVYITDPNMEILLLLVSAALKLRIRDRIFYFFRKNYFSNAELSEFHWLQDRLDLDKVIANAEMLLPKKSIEPFKEIITTSQPTIHQITQFRKHTKPEMQLYRTYTAFGAGWRQYLRELVWIGRYINKKYLHTAVPLKRVNVKGGLLVAVLGCDGAGKSTQIKEIQKWLSWKVDVLPVYFGSGDGSSSLLRWPMKLAAKLLRNRTGIRAEKYQNVSNHHEDDASERRSGSRLGLIAKVLWASALALEKRRKLRKANMARNRGMVVICDRYPQNQIMGFNDGPLLSGLLGHRSSILRAIARWEGRPYSLAEDYSPDIVIKLTITPDLAVERKKDMCIEESWRRVEAINNLQYGSETKVKVIDASKPLDEVLLEMKRCIWEEF